MEDFEVDKINLTDKRSILLDALSLPKGHDIRDELLQKVSENYDWSRENANRQLKFMVLSSCYTYAGM